MVDRYSVLAGGMVQAPNPRTKGLDASVTTLNGTLDFILEEKAKYLELRATADAKAAAQGEIDAAIAGKKAVEADLARSREDAKQLGIELAVEKQNLALAQARIQAQEQFQLQSEGRIKAANDRAVLAETKAAQQKPVVVTKQAQAVKPASFRLEVVRAGDGLIQEVIAKPI